jgi:hypothetical protein
MQILKFGALAALGATLAGPAMAYLSKDQVIQLTGYGHGDGLAGYGPNGQAVSSSTGPNHSYIAGSSGGTTWTWPAPLRQSGPATAMTTGPGGATWTWPVPLRESESKMAMTTGPGAPVPHAVE